MIVNVPIQVAQPVHEATRHLVENDVYRGFHPIPRWVLRIWKDLVVRLSEDDGTTAALAAVDTRLQAGNIVIFIDHHYAFDALPIALGLAKRLRRVDAVMLPYASHLDMRLDPDGFPSWRYRLRTQAWHWLVEGIRRGAPTVQFLPTAREFELNNPRLKTIVDERYSHANTTYLKALVQMFTEHETGQVCFLAPTAGLALPTRASLNPQLYRSMDLVQKRANTGVPFFFVGAYPRWEVHRHYFAPLLARHQIVARGPFVLPRDHYDDALSTVARELAALRDQAHFTPPDYSRIKHK